MARVGVLVSRVSRINAKFSEQVAAVSGEADGVNELVAKSVNGGQGQWAGDQNKWTDDRFDDRLH